MKKTGIIFILILLSAVLSGCSQKSADSPVFEDGCAQPVFPYTAAGKDYNNEKSNIVRFPVWVETDNDMDRDGRKDVVKALVQLPRAAYEGKYKAASIFEARPYIAGKQSLKATDEALDRVSTNVDPESWYYEDPFKEGEMCYEDLIWYDYFLVRGFAVVTSAGPGTLGSDGFVSIGGKEETEAFAAVIEWLHGDRKAYADIGRAKEANADWSNGNVGMTGKSYGGTTQYALAARGVNGLKTIVPVAGITSWYSYVQGQGVSLDVTDTYLSYLSQRCASKTFNTEEFQKTREAYIGYLRDLDRRTAELDGNYGGVWEEREYVTKLNDNSVSMLIVEGMNDNNVRTNQLSDIGYQLWDKGYEYKLILHQGGHQVPSDPIDKAAIMIGDQSYDDLLNRWFSHYLYGVDNGIEKMPVLQYQSNLDGSWRGYDPMEFNYGTASYSLEPAHISSAELPKSFESWTEDVWYKKDDPSVKRYELTTAGDDGLEIFESVALTLRLTLDNIPKDADDLMVSAYLVDEADAPFEAYVNDTEKDRVPIRVLEKGSMTQVPRVSAYDLCEYQKTETDHKVISRAWFDLCNPEAWDSPDGWRKRSEPVEKGQTYEYMISMDPVIYTVAPGHKMVLYLFCYDLGRIAENSKGDIPASFYHSLDCEYGFTVNRQSRLVLSVEGKGSDQVSALDPSAYELTEEKKILIDSDTAGDDAMAIMMAAKSPKVKIMGVTVLPGNVSMEQALKNALMTLEVAGCDAPVYAGSEVFLSGEPPETFSIFGKDGMGDCDLIHPSGKPEEGSAVDFILDTVKENPGEIEIVEIGPSTNVALAIRKDPETMKKVKKIWLMGSAGQGIGNATPVAEFNVLKDAEAVGVLLASGISITFVGWDIALDNRTYFYYNDMAELAEGSEAGKFLVKAFSKLSQNKLNQYGQYYIDMADPLAMAACIWPDYISETKKCYAFCCTDKAYMPVYGQVVFYDKDKTYDACFTVPEANCELASAQKADEFVERTTELLGRK